MLKAEPSVLHICNFLKFSIKHPRLSYEIQNKKRKKKKKKRKLPSQLGLIFDLTRILSYIDKHVCKLGITNHGQYHTARASRPLLLPRRTCGRATTRAYQKAKEAPRPRCTPASAHPHDCPRRPGKVVTPAHFLGVVYAIHGYPPSGGNLPRCPCVRDACRASMRQVLKPQD